MDAADEQYYAPPSSASQRPPLGVRALLVLLALRLVLWSAAVVALIYLVASQRPGAAFAIWKVAGLLGSFPGSLDAYGIGQLAIVAGSSLAFHVAILTTLILRRRHAANLLLTAWAVVAIAMDHPGLDGVLFIPAWLLLVSPTTQRHLGGDPDDEARSRPRAWSWNERARLCGYVLLSAFVPGLGQLLLRRWRRAAAVFVPWLFGWVTHLEPLWTLMTLFAMSDAGWMAVERLRARPGTAEPSAPTM